jgi:hypothetical protein
MDYLLSREFKTSFDSSNDSQVGPVISKRIREITFNRTEFTLILIENGLHYWIVIMKSAPL